MNINYYWLLIVFNVNFLLSCMNAWVKNTKTKSTSRQNIQHTHSVLRFNNVVMLAHVKTSEREMIRKGERHFSEILSHTGGDTFVVRVGWSVTLILNIKSSPSFRGEFGWWPCLGKLALELPISFHPPPLPHTHFLSVVVWVYINSKLKSNSRLLVKFKFKAVSVNCNHI